LATAPSRWDVSCHELPFPNAPSPILTTAVVPWSERFEFDAETFRRPVRTIARGLTPHIYLFICFRDAPPTQRRGP
jgi:hypothetical protein